MQKFQQGHFFNQTTDPDCSAETRTTDPKDNKKVSKATDIKIGQLVFVKDHCKGTLNPTYIFNHSVAGIVLLTTLDGKEKKV